MKKGLKDMYSTSFSQVGANIQQILKKKSMTQQNLADALNISKQVMNKIIKGTKAININEINQISKVLDVSVDYLLSEHQIEKTTETMAFLEIIEDDSAKEQVEMIMNVIDEIRLLEDMYV